MMAALRTGTANGEEADMGAKQKLNNAYFTGSLLLAGFVGWAAGSWWVFLITALLLLALNLCNGDIR